MTTIGYPEFNQDIQQYFSFLSSEYKMFHYEADETEQSWMCAFYNDKMEIIFSINSPWNHLDMQIIDKNLNRNILPYLEEFLNADPEQVSAINEAFSGISASGDLRA